jgi:hypothetical protein
MAKQQWQREQMMEPLYRAVVVMMMVVVVVVVWLTVGRPKNLENQELAWCSMWAFVECQALSSVALACQLKVEASMARQQWQREQVMEPSHRAVVVWLAANRPKNLENQELVW